MRWFLYEPARPVRPDVYGEGIFVERWQAAMREPMEYGDGLENEAFQAIMSPLDAQARDAIAATSFICWLGTNCGRSYLWQATKLHDNHDLDWDDAYTLAWANLDRREPGINGGMRTMEALMERESITVRAVEVVARIAAWLGSPNGRKMVQAAEHEIELTSREIINRNAMDQRVRARVDQVLEIRNGR